MKGARTVKLFWNVLTKLLPGLVLVGLFLFLPAGTSEVQVDSLCLVSIWGAMFFATKEFMI